MTAELRHFLVFDTTSTIKSFQAVNRAPRDAALKGATSGMTSIGVYDPKHQRTTYYKGGRRDMPERRKTAHAIAKGFKFEAWVTKEVCKRSHMNDNVLHMGTQDKCLDCREQSYAHANDTTSTTSDHV
jgi:hypothetical protein